MKRCPECRRDYYDDTLLYCLDDGNALLEGPAADRLDTIEMAFGERTHLLPKEQVGNSDGSRWKSGPGNYLLFKRSDLIKRMQWPALALTLLLIVGLGYLMYRSFSGAGNNSQIGSTQQNLLEDKLYWQMTQPEQDSLIRLRTKSIQSMIGDETTDLDDEAVQLIKVELDDYVGRRDSLSQKPTEEGLRVIFGRASQYAPLLIQAYQAKKIPPALGLYQAMVESEYRDCPKTPFPRGPVGIFQFTPSTASRLGLKPEDYCDVRKQSEVAASYMSDLTSDFGEGRSNATLGLMGYSMGETLVRVWLHQLRDRGVMERGFWAILRHRHELSPSPEPTRPPLPLIQRGYFNYVPRFFAAAIIGETPNVFGLSTPPLTSIKPNVQ